MCPRLARQARDAVPVVVFFVIVALTWDTVRWYLAPGTGPREPLTAVLIGVLLALPLIVLESSALSERFRRLQFGAAVLVKTATYVAARGVIVLGVGWILGLLDGLDLPPELTPAPMGAVALRGVGEPTEIVAFL